MIELHIYLVISVLFSLFMFTIWSKEGWLNVIIKFGILLFAVFGIIELIKEKVFS